MCVVPVDPGAGEERPRLTHGLPDRKVHAMRRNVQVSLADPDLGPAGIDIQQS